MNYIKFFFPTLALITFAILCRNYNAPAILHLSLVVTALAAFRWRTLRSPQTLVSLFVFGCLLLSYLTRARDIHYFVKSLTYAGYPLVAYFAVTRYWESLRRKSVFFLSLAFGALSAQWNMLGEIRHVWSQPVESWFTASTEPGSGLYPLGAKSPLIEDQGVRYPELLKNEMSFLGSRGLFCDVHFHEDVVTMCSENWSSPPFAIWTTFFITRKYVHLFENQEMFLSEVKAVLGSFRQGLRRGRDSFGRTEIAPICSTDGYMAIEQVSGDSISVAIATPKPFLARLPVLEARGQNIRLAGAGVLSSDDAGIVTVDARPGLTNLEIAAPLRWRLAVILFWLPFAVFVIAQICFAVSRMFKRKEDSKLVVIPLEDVDAFPLPAMTATENRPPPLTQDL